MTPSVQPSYNSTVSRLARKLPAGVLVQLYLRFFFMILHSTAEPDSYAASPTDSSTWTFPGAPVRVNIRLSLISRLQTELNRRGEVGGVLLGHKGNAPATVEICDCIRIPGENQSDGLYTLKESELERLRQTDSGLEEQTAHGSGLFCNWYRGLSVVGYFRTHSKDVLRLRDAEIVLVRKRFPDPSSVVLLIETSRGKSEAGFFFPNTSVPFSFANFPFDAALLQRRAAPHLMESPAPPSEEVAELPPELEIAANGGPSGSLGLRIRTAASSVLQTLAGLRARLTPSGLRIRTAASAALRTLAGLRTRWVPSSLQIRFAASAVLRKLAGLRTRWVPSSLQIRLAASALLRTLAGLRARWVPSSLRIRSAASAVLQRLAGLWNRWVPSARSAPSRSLLATAGAVLVVITMAAILLIFRAHVVTYADNFVILSRGYATRALNWTRNVDTPQARSPFQLSVQAEGKGVDVRWDPQSTPRASAHEGRLVIMAPEKQPKTVTLGPDQLASGHMYYPSSTSRLTFRLDVIDSAGSILASSSSTPVGASLNAARERRPAGFTVPRPPQSVPAASAMAPSVALRPSGNGAKSNPLPTVQDRVEPVVATTVPAAAPSVDQISIGTERQDITEKFGDPAISVAKMVGGHFIETLVYVPERAHAETIISLEDGKVSSTSSRYRASNQRRRAAGDQAR